jgi:two-component system, response regulator PdtaR
MKGLKILICEDEFLPATDLKKQLTALGYVVLGMFIKAEQGLDYMEKYHGTESFPDVVILDITLKGKMDGIEAMKVIREKYCCGIMILTGLGQLELIEAIVEEKPVPFLIKPFDIYMVHVGLQLAVYQARLEKENKVLQVEVNKRLNPIL